MVNTPAIYQLSPIYHFWHFGVIFTISVFFLHIFFLHFFAFFYYVFNNEDFWCALGITNMVKAKISGITNTPQKTCRENNLFQNFFAD